MMKGVSGYGQFSKSYNRVEAFFNRIKYRRDEAPQPSWTFRLRDATMPNVLPKQIWILRTRARYPQKF